MRVLAVVAVIAAVSLATSARACMWDVDTLAEEAAAMPGVRAAIAGDFPRHSPAYYRWRIRDRLAAIAAGDHDLRHYDDLVVAYDKLGDTAQAIAWAEKAAARQADRYETEANWGTVLIHGGLYADGLAHLRRAVAINPDAHFGRERYQILLVEYVIARRSREGAPALPLSPWPRRADRYADFGQMVLFAALDRAAGDPAQVDRDRELRAAVRGVVGMIRFGHHDSPVLMEALGDLLAEQRHAHLAARAYSRAALSDKAVEDPYVQLANGVAPYTPAEMAQMNAQRDRLPPIVANSHDTVASERLMLIYRALLDEIAAGDDLQQRIAADETRWIAAAADVDTLYQRTYLTPAPTGERIRSR